MLHVNYSILLRAACNSVSYFDCLYSLYCTLFSNVSLLCVSPTFTLEQKKMGVKVISLRLWHKFFYQTGGGRAGGGGQRSLIANIVALGKS
jgi:hypothetical protein